MSYQKECKKPSKLISNFLHKKNMFCLKQVCVHWVNLMKNKSYQNFKALKYWIKWLQGKRLISLYQFASCLYPLSSKFLAQKNVICVLVNQNIDVQLCMHVKNHWHHMNYFILCYSILFTQIYPCKSNPKKCWSFYSFCWNSNCEWTVYNF